MPKQIKHEIEIEGLPEWWRAVAYRLPLEYECIFDQDAGIVVDSSLRTPAIRLIVEKIKPRRIVLAETDEFRKAKPGEYYEHSGGMSVRNSHTETSEEYKIWHVVDKGE